MAFFETVRADRQQVQLRVTDGDHGGRPPWNVAIEDALAFIDAHLEPVSPSPAAARP